MASIHPHRSGWRICYRVLGTQINEKYSDKHDAQQRQIEVEYMLSRSIDPRTGVKMVALKGISMKEACKIFGDWSRAKGRAIRTLDRDLEFVDRLADLGYDSPVQIKAQDIERFIVDLRGKRKNEEDEWETDPNKMLSPSSVNKAIFGIKAFFRCLSELGYIAENPAKNLKAVRVLDRIPEILSVGELSRLLGGFSEYHRPFAMFVAVFGCRISEACNLRWEDVDLPRVVIRGPKERRDKVLVLPSALCQIIRKLPKTSQYVFPNEKGGKRQHSLGYLIKRAAEKAGIDPKRVHWHLLRHSAATRLVMSEPTAVVQRILGHARLQTTERYLHVRSGYLDDVANGSLAEYMDEIAPKKE